MPDCLCLTWSSTSRTTEPITCTSFPLNQRPRAAGDHARGRRHHDGQHGCGSRRSSSSPRWRQHRAEPLDPAWPWPSASSCGGPCSRSPVPSPTAMGRGACCTGRPRPARSGLRADAADARDLGTDRDAGPLGDRCGCRQRLLGTHRRRRSARLPVTTRGAASGVINAGGSFGQFVFAPILQKLMRSSA